MKKIGFMILLVFSSTGNVLAEEWHEAHKCLVDNVLYEARSEGYEGMVAVAYVTMNRVESRKYPDTVCEVVYQRKQFSWTHMLKRMKPINEYVEGEVIHLARVIAADVLTKRYEDITNGSLWYHRNDVYPVWRKDYTVSRKIGRHIFYYKHTNLPIN